MPEQDGIEATRRIRALLGPEESIPIIALTAEAMMEQRQQCLDAGMNDHVTKPIILRELVQVMARWTSQVRTEEPAGKTPPPPPPMIEEEFSSIINTVVLAELADMVGWEDVVGLFENLVEELAARGEIMAGADEADDIEVLGREAHSLKSSLGQFGATRAHDAAREIDALCKAGGGETARQLVPRFIHQCDEALTALRQYLATMAPLRSSGS